MKKVNNLEFDDTTTMKADIGKIRFSRNVNLLTATTYTLCSLQTTNQFKDFCFITLVLMHLIIAYKQNENLKLTKNKDAKCKKMI